MNIKNALMSKKFKKIVYAEKYVELIQQLIPQPESAVLDVLYFTDMMSSGTLLGTSVPVVMTSRTDTPEGKYYSILTAIMQSL